MSCEFSQWHMGGTFWKTCIWIHLAIAPSELTEFRLQLSYVVLFVLGIPSVPTQTYTCQTSCSWCLQRETRAFFLPNLTPSGENRMIWRFIGKTYKQTKQTKQTKTSNDHHTAYSLMDNRETCLLLLPQLLCDELIQCCATDAIHIH